jgi:hypothetical protein
MQEQSIYDENYKPLFINDMDVETLQKFSSALSEKLRHVKLAISKATLSQNKFNKFQEIAGKKQGRDFKSIMEDIYGISRRHLNPISKKSNIREYIDKDNFKYDDKNDAHKKFELMKAEFDKQYTGLQIQLPQNIQKSRLSPIKRKGSGTNNNAYDTYFN